ncbi:MAG: HEAT repeat domain-containing protein [Armatimonadetes bacterium]|nr:HEAT repeat domain-containing protein [Armatimonadota bacterium]
MAGFFWKLLPAVRRPERSRFLFFMSLSGLITLAQTLGLIGAESLLLSELGAGALPATFVAASILTVLGTLVYAFGVDQSRNDTYFISILVTLAAMVAVGTFGASQGLRLILPGLFCLYYLALSVLQNHYWTFTGDYFDTLAAKRLFPLFVVGSSIGGFLGGILALLLGRPALLMMAWSGALLLAAMLLRASRRQLRRWGPLELAEADETSLEGLLASVRYLRQSALGRWLVISALGMVLALFVSQYLYSSIFAATFPDSRRLALFLSGFLAVTNFLEIIIEVAITPWLIQRLGVASANLVHPLLTMGCFLFLAFDQSLAAAAVARINRETMDNAMSQPVRSLVYNALPARFRGRMRAFLEGIVVYSGMVTAGVFLLTIGGRLPYFWLCVAGAGTALLFLAANLGVRNEYLKTLVVELRAGRLDLSEVGSDFGALEMARLSNLWESILKEEADDPRAALALADTLASKGVLGPLQHSANHPDPRVRVACLRALGRHAQDRCLDLLLRGVDDPDTEVRLVAISSLPGQSQGDWSAVKSRLGDSDPRVRAQAAIRTGDSGLKVLAAMCQEADPEVSIAALKVLPPNMAAFAKSRGEDPATDIRAAALERLAHICVSVEPELITSNLKCSDAAVRLAVTRLLPSCKEQWAVVSLASSLGDPAREVRTLAAHLLAEMEETGLDAVEPYLHSESTRTVTAAIQALSWCSNPRARVALEGELRTEVRQAWKHLIALHLLPEDGSLPQQFLRLALHNAVERNRRTAFQILESIEDSKVMRSVEKVLRFANARVRADALEVLSNLGDREASSLLVLMLEEGALEDKIPLVSSQVEAPTNQWQILEMIQNSPDRWVRIAAEGAINPPGEGSRREEMMERLLVLRKVPLFAQMTLEQLEAINQLLSEEEYLEGEVVFREGDVGDELYIVVEGEVTIVKSYGTAEELVLVKLGPGTYFGEMAILDDEPRSATVYCSKNSRLMVLKGEQLKELVFQMPEIAFEIFKVLTARIRSADTRLNEMKRDLQTAQSTTDQRARR